MSNKVWCFSSSSCASFCRGFSNQLSQFDFKSQHETFQTTQFIVRRGFKVWWWLLKLSSYFPYINSFPSPLLLSTVARVCFKLDQIIYMLTFGDPHNIVMPNYPIDTLVLGFVGGILCSFPAKVLDGISNASLSNNILTILFRKHFFGFWKTVFTFWKINTSYHIGLMVLNCSIGP